jgi:hypothetical protein
MSNILTTQNSITDLDWVDSDWHRYPPMSNIATPLTSRTSQDSQRRQQGSVTNLSDILSTPSRSVRPSNTDQSMYPTNSSRGGRVSPGESLLSRDPPRSVSHTPAGSSQRLPPMSPLDTPSSYYTPQFESGSLSSNRPLPAGNMRQQAAQQNGTMQTGSRSGSTIPGNMSQSTFQRTGIPRPGSTVPLMGFGPTSMMSDSSSSSSSPGSIAPMSRSNSTAFQQSGGMSRSNSVSQPSFQQSAMQSAMQSGGGLSRSNSTLSAVAPTVWHPIWRHVGLL